MLADDRRGIGHPVEHRAQLVFEQRALFLDHQHLRQAGGKLARNARLERPDHADLQGADAELIEARRIEPECHEGLLKILPGFAGCHHADPGALPGTADEIEPIGPRIGHRAMQFVVIEAVFLGQRRVIGPGVHTAVGHRLLGRLDDFRRIGRDMHRAAAFDYVGHHFHARPAAGIAAHRNAVQTEVEQLLRIARIEQRNAGRHEVQVGIIGDG